MSPGMHTGWARRLLGMVLAMAGWLPWAAHSATLDLSGYTDADGAITIQHGGDTVDPYFTLQALLLAHDHGLNNEALAVAWARWLLPRQKPDATFDRFCRRGPVWLGCKTADADDALLALWLRFIDTLPPAVQRERAMASSRQRSHQALTRLLDVPRGIYLVSPVYQHGLFMDNLEVWTYRGAHAPAQGRSQSAFTRAIQRVFWDTERQRYHVSTQPEQRDATPAFYPDAVAQLFPLMVDFPGVPGGAPAHYRRWITEHRATWLRQVEHDFAWGLVALVALRQGDTASAQCWRQATAAHRHTSHWTATDETALQILNARGLPAAAATLSCHGTPTP